MPAALRTVYVVTHPEATHHVDGAVGGWHDSRLTPAGMRAAARIADALRERIPEDADVELVTSDLRRTRETADAIVDRFGVEPVLDRRLREKSYGEAEGGPKRGWTSVSCLRPPSGSGWTTTKA
jgi:2,3-bisphosphoglycerate-dependent phosphoglycerate mutase